MYCSASCRQNAYVDRLRDNQVDAVSDDELIAELRRRIDNDLNGWAMRLTRMVGEFA